MQSIVAEILQDEDKMLLVLGAGVIALWLLLRVFSGVLTTMARERTKREIAAYIAEGSMTPEQGERLIKAGKRSRGSCG
ncbi:MAG TPA: hypothetical protein ENK11_01245 [Phycisphaerales bacterium]|nr:hypothetical protein [Phycisphaerales bacterium]